LGQIAQKYLKNSDKSGLLKTCRKEVFAIENAGITAQNIN